MTAAVNVIFGADFNRSLFHLEFSRCALCVSYV